MNTLEVLRILNKEMQVAIGCTEPIAIAFAAALARKYVKGEKATSIKVLASGNVIKNAMSVSIPGANGSGINLAAALGALSKDSGKKLEVLAGLTPSDFENAKNMISDDIVKVDLSDSPKKLYIEVIVETKISKARVVIEDSHTNVVLIDVDGRKVEFAYGEEAVSKLENEDTIEIENFNLDSIWNFCLNVDMNEMEIIRKSIALNTAISREGLNGSYGLEVGKTIKINVQKGLLADDISSYASSLTAAGSDARMAGCMMPVMSNSGSGNQGILATMPVVAVAEKLKIDRDKMERAALLSNLITIYIKSKFGVLSALCGATIAAVGASCGITYLLSGGLPEVKHSIQNMLADVTGMFCDGAKPGCALKVSTCVQAAISASLMALRGISATFTEGIIENNPEKTIDNLCRLANHGTTEVDRIILDIMLKKTYC